MLDRFLADLFSPDTFKPIMPSSFGDMAGGLFGGAGDKAVMDRLSGSADPTSGGVIGDVLARDQLTNRLSNGNVLTSPGDGGGAMPDAAETVPLPRPRPVIDAPSAPAPAPQLPAADSPMLQRLFGGGGASGAGAPMPAPAAPAQPQQSSLMGRLFGLDPRADRQFRASLAGGLSGGNPAFGGGAFMQGMSGSMNKALGSEKEDRAEDLAARSAGQKQDNFNRQQADREKRTGMMDRLYGARTSSILSGGPKGSAWNKPASERWKDAQRLIIDKQKQLSGSLPLAGKARQDAEAAATKEMEKFRRDTYRAYGIDENGNDTGGAKPSGGAPSKAMSNKEATDAGLYPKGDYNDPAKPESQDEFDALPPGTVYVNPSDGQLYTKK